MSEIPDPETREAVADRISEHPAAELEDFTRDVYKTMVVSIRTDAAGAELTAVGEEAGYTVTSGPDGQELVFETRDGASEKVRAGGNRL